MSDSIPQYRAWGGRLKYLLMLFRITNRRVLYQFWPHRLEMPTLKKWAPLHCRIKGTPPCRLMCPVKWSSPDPLTPACPEWEPFDRSWSVGKDAWILLDMAAGWPPNSTCARCHKKFEGRNVAVEQGANLQVLLWEDQAPDGSYRSEDCFTLAPDEVEVLP